MALAPYNEKAALSAAHLLKNFEYEAFKLQLEAQQIAIVFDDDAAASTEGKWTLELIVNLLAKLYPVLSIMPLEGDKNRLAAWLKEHAKAINPRIELEEGLADTSVCVVVGSRVPVGPQRIIYAGSDGWIAKFSAFEPVRSGTTHNPFGAGAAACFAAANVFRAVFAEQLHNNALDGRLTFSVLDHTQGEEILRNPNLIDVDLQESFLVGLGAIGNGAIWALARCQNLTGDLHLIDHEALDATNPQRYVLARYTDGVEAVPKVSVAMREFAMTSFTPQLHFERWGEYLLKRGDWHLGRVAVALDTAADRTSIQASLPEWVVNAWTQPENLGVSRHAFLDEYACLACLYWPTEKIKDESTLVAEAINLPDDDLLRRLLYTDQPVPRDYLLQIAAAKALPEEAVLAFEGATLRQFYSRAICGGALLPCGVEASEGTQAEIPMAFQSALAGIMLAAELVGHAGKLKIGPPTKTEINLLRPLQKHLSSYLKKTDRCFCQDTDFIEAYRTKYHNLVTQ